MAEVYNIADTNFYGRTAAFRLEFFQSEHLVAVADNFWGPNLSTTRLINPLNVTDDCFRCLVVSLVHSRLDYGNFVLVRLPVFLQRRLQSVLNAAARLVSRLRRYDHVTDAVATLHWLRLPQRIDFKVAVVAFRVLHGLAPPYLNQLSRVADLPSRC